MFVFPANDEGYRRRKRAHKACEQCKRRRRRCDFPGDSVRCEPCRKAEIMCSLAPDFELPVKETPRYDKLAKQALFTRPSFKRTSSYTSGAAQSTGPSPTTSPQPENLGRLSRPSLGPRSTSYHVGTQLSEKNNDIKLESDIVQPNGSLGHKRNSSLVDRNGEVGFREWANKHRKSSIPDRVTQARIDRESIGMWVKGAKSQQRLNPHLHTYLSAINAFSMPLREDRSALIDLYCQSVDPLFPILDTDHFMKLHEIGQAPTILLHAVLLVAARHSRAGPYLGHESVRQFCANCTEKIRALLFAKVEQDRLTLVRVHALLSLHSEGPDGLEDSCADLEAAIHYAISLGIHHERPFVDKVALKKLWWSIWCMDRISCCVNARPLLINSEDMGISVVTSDEHLELSQLIESCQELEKVIYLYRPRRVGSDTTEIPPEVDALFVGDDCVDPFNAVRALLHYTSFILAHKRVNLEDSLPEEPVILEDSGLTPATKHGKRHESHLDGDSSKNSSRQRGKDHKNKQSRPLSMEAASRFRKQGNYGPRTIGTMYTPLTMVLAEERLRLKSGVPSPSIEQRIEDYFTLSSPQSDPLSDAPGDEPKSKDDALLLSAAGAVLRIIKYAPELVPVPLIPYCLSLTLTVFLRAYPRWDSETGLGWKDACSLLEGMADRWWVAGAMGCMGRNVFESLERAQLALRQLDEPMKQEKEPEMKEWKVSVPDMTTEIMTFDGTTTPGTSTGNGSNQLPAVSEDMFLNMFSDLPNQTSFLDEAINLEAFSGMEQWLKEKTFQ